MKKILFILSILFSVVAYSQTTIPGYTNINSRYWWEAGLFKALGIPAGDSAQFRAGQAVRAGAQYYDSTGADAGLYMWTGTVWQRQDIGSQPQFCNGFSLTPSVTYEDGFTFSLSEGEYTIDCLPYDSDSLTVTLDTADDNYDRYDVFYVDATGAHVLKGTAEELATVPSLEAGQLFIAWVRIPANATEPDISSVYIWRNNAEWTGAQSGATVDFDNTANVHEGTKAINWTNVNNGDLITLTYSDTVDLSDYHALSIHPRLKQVIQATANLRLQWFLGTTAVSNEISIPLNKSSINQYQAVSMPMSLWTIQNNNANRLRIRYTNNNAAIISGFYLDYIFLEQGLIIPGEPGSGSDITLTMPSPLFSVQNNNGDFTVTMPGSSTSIVNADGTTRTYDAVTDVGAYNSLGTHSNGAQVSGNEIIFHDGDGVDPGMIGAFDWRRFDTTANLTAESMGTGFPVIVEVTPFRTAFYSFAEGSGINIDTTGGTMTFSTTGGGGGGRFGVSGEDDTQAEARLFTTTGESFRIRGASGIFFQQETPGNDSTTLVVDNQHVLLDSRNVFGVTWGTIDLSQDNILFDNWQGNYQFTLLEEPPGSTNKMVIWDSTSNRLYVTAISGGGGGGSGLFPTIGTGTATGNVIGDLDGNTLSVQQGGNDFLSIDPTAGNEVSTFRAYNITDDDNVSQFQATTNDLAAGFELAAFFNGGVRVAMVDGNAESGSATLEYTADTHTFTGAVILGTGGTGAGTAFLYEQAGSLLTASEDGAHEYDGKARYFTTATGRGLIPTVSWSMVNADFPLSDVNTAQVCLPPAQDVITLQGGTTYEFEGQWNVLCGTASHAFGMGFSQGGTGTLDTIRYNTIGWAGPDNNTASVQASGRYVNITPNTLQMAASAVGGNNVVFRGIIVVAPGDPITLTPQIQFSAAPGGTNIMKRGSYIKFSPIGSNTVTSIGNVN